MAAKRKGIPIGNEVYSATIRIDSKGMIKRRVKDVLRSLDVDTRKGISKHSQEMLKDLLYSLKKTAPVFTGTLKKSGKITQVKSKESGKVIGGTLMFNATQQQQYDNMTYRQRWIVYKKMIEEGEDEDFFSFSDTPSAGGNPLAGKSTKNGNTYEEVSWTPEDPDAGYIHLIENNGGEEWLKKGFDFFYAKHAVKKGKIPIAGDWFNKSDLAAQVVDFFGDNADMLTKEIIDDLQTKAFTKSAAKSKYEKALETIAKLEEERGKLRKGVKVEGITKDMTEEDARKLAVPVNEAFYTHAKNAGYSVDTVEGHGVYKYKTEYFISPRADWDLFSGKRAELRRAKAFVKQYEQTKGKLPKRGRPRKKK